MQKISSLFFIYSCILLFNGCGNKQDISTNQKNSFFSKVTKGKNHTKSKNTNNLAEAFNLDANQMESFALDDKLAQHSSNDSSTQRANTNSLFSWEDLAAEESKDEFKKLHFEFNSFSLDPKHKKDLKLNIAHAKKMIKKGKTIVIEGHSCHSAGSAIYNLTLSEQRARHIAQKFADAGIKTESIKIAPRGDEMPLKKGGNREEQQINRRVEIFAIDAN